ncbi:histone acetyltransferase subunit NuA4-domain-containing protein [Dunaliella salina]|uniref:Histone acetyltransferase subunit NuA4-domain-containing protein n=1 Tax=Dunaliella salina TaxID=3046 RepID=A0ABQ7G9K6_DUNSA|nr:histone acetyltransferase subunit NuA4-domain-containing protein [Dunaliella salina]|eukprot:KAF5831294.1 histone acetyltransferase subunit NuA4-domain-containing protein [Dunaliella salina]
MKRQRKTSSRAKQAMEESPESDVAFHQQLPVQQQQQPPAPPPQAPSKKKSKVSQSSSVQQQVPDDATLEDRIRQNQEHLRAVEKQIYTLETLYFENANPCGNAIKGYDNLFATNAKKAQLKHEDRIFSGSSVTGQLP